MSFAPSYAKLSDLDELRTLARNLAAEKKPFGFDVETGYEGESREKASLHPEDNFLVSYQFTNSMRWGRMVPLRFDSGENCDNFAVAEILWELHHAVDDEGLPLGVAHGAIFELRCMARWFYEHLKDHPAYGEAVRESKGYFPIRSCTLLESFVEAANQRHGLKEITQQNFGHVMRELLSLFPEGLTAKQRKSIRFNVLDPDSPEVVAYSCEDALWCLRHHLFRYERVKDSFIYQLEMQVLYVIAEMADEGVYYDWNLMRDAARKTHEFADKYLAEVVADFSELAGEPVAINFNSSKQFSNLLYEKCGMPVRHKTPGGNPSVDAKVALPDLAKKYPPVQRYLDWSKLNTLCTNFLDTYEGKFGYAADGRAHPSLIQHGTITGRFSCEDPNYQQSPKKYKYTLASGEEYYFNFRDCIAAPPGRYILGFDYSQIELRILAGEAGETALIEAFANGEDVHRLTAALMLGMRLEDVSDDDRSVGKTMNFALVYGMSEGGLADRLGITLADAEALFAQYHAAYPAIKAWTERTVNEAKRTGYVFTKWERKVPIWEFNEVDRKRRRDGERTAGNAPIQGSAGGDYVKIAMVRARKALKAAGMDDRVRLVMNIHDALELEVDKSLPPAEVIRVLQPAVVFPVAGWPAMVAEWHMGERWGSVVELDVLDDGSVRVKKKGAVGSTAGGPEVEEKTAGELAAEYRAEQIAARPPEEELVRVEEIQQRQGVEALRMLGPSDEPVAGPGPARTVIISVGYMVNQDSARALQQLLSRLPGRNTVRLSTPQGDIDIPGTYNLTPKLEPQVSIILGGASVKYDEQSVDLEELAAGIEL